MEIQEYLPMNLEPIILMFSLKGHQEYIAIHIKVQDGIMLKQ